MSSISLYDSPDWTMEAAHQSLDARLAQCPPLVVDSVSQLRSISGSLWESIDGATNVWPQVFDDIQIRAFATTWHQLQHPEESPVRSSRWISPPPPPPPPPPPRRRQNLTGPPFLSSWNTHSSLQCTVRESLSLRCNLCWAQASRVCKWYNKIALCWATIWIISRFVKKNEIYLHQVHISQYKSIW